MTSEVIKKLTGLVVSTRLTERKNSTLMLNATDSKGLAIYMYEHLIQVPGTVEMKYHMSLMQFLVEEQYLRFKTFRGMKLEWDTDAGASCVFVGEAV